MTKEEIKFAIEYLNKIMPEWDYEANMYYPDAYHGLGELICAEPEGYVFKTAIEALEEADRFVGLSKMWNDHLNKYRWHDYPNELPFNGEEILIYTNDNDYRVVNYGYQNMNMIVAWKYIEPCEVKK